MLAERRSERRDTLVQRYTKVRDRGLSAELSANFEGIEIREAEAEPEQQEHKEKQGP